MLNTEQIIKEYVDDKKSVYEIAEAHQTYAQKIRRLLIKNGVKMRDKGEAQSIALKNGRVEHPTAGKGHSAEAKIKISEAAAVMWKNMDDDDYENRVDKMKKNWENIPDDVKREMQEKASEAVRQAAKDGSKMEKHISGALLQAGYQVYSHKVFEIPGHSLEVDIYLPAENIVIEIDGPSHFFPIWGEDKLQKHIKADEVKNSLLLGYGVKVLRVKNLSKSFTEKIKRDTAVGILEGIDRLKNGETFIELEIV